MSKKYLIGCEQFGVVRDAFLSLGYDAWSCDIEPCRTGSNRHIKDDILDVLKWEQWDFMFIAHPPCTRLANSGVTWLSKPPKGKTIEQLQDELVKAADFFSTILWANIPHRCIENPVMHKYAKKLIKNFYPHNDSFQPYEFATSIDDINNESKRTCLWTHRLPKLKKLNIMSQKTARQTGHHLPPSPDRAIQRAKFYPGPALAMAKQYGDYVEAQPSLFL